MAKEIYRTVVSCEYVSTGGVALSKSDNRQGVAVVLAPNSNVDDATPKVQKGVTANTDIYGVLLFLDEGSERAQVCTDGIVRMKMDSTAGASATTSMTRRGVIMTDTANSNGLVKIADEEKGNGQIVAVFSNISLSRYDLLVDLGRHPAQVTP